MIKQPFYPVILAAGQGSRMKSDLPKVLHTVGGLPLLYHVIQTVQDMGCGDVCVVTSPNMKDIRTSSEIQHAIQEKPLGTAHAVLSAASYIEKTKLPILVLYGDTPLIQENTLKLMVKALQEAHVVVLGMQVRVDNNYGRIFADNTGCINRIVEAKDATAAEKENSLCNSGVMLVRHDICLPLLQKVKNNNAKKEFYLTDLIELGNKAGYRSQVIIRDHDELRGVNTRQDLAEIEHAFQERKRVAFLDAGVTLVDPKTVYFSYDTLIGQDVIIAPHVVIGPKTTIESGAVIKSFSVLEGAHVGQGASVGPFARLRPGTYIGAKSKIGNFVEIKQSKLGEGTKVSHLSYIGDATLGAGVNIGAGTITCNYDGFRKHQTVLENNVFIGSNTSLVAPVHLEAGVMVAAGTVVTENAPKDSLVIARTGQHNIKDGAKRFRKKNS